MAAALAAVMLFGCTKPEEKTLRLINWNIQNGMWDGQNDNYFNIAAMSFTPEIIREVVERHVPGFQMEYNVDPVKDQISRSWPNSLDDTCAREEWGWKPEWDLESMTKDMLEKVAAKLK